MIDVQRNGHGYSGPIARAARDRVFSAHHGRSFFYPQEAEGPFFFGGPGIETFAIVCYFEDQIAVYQLQTAGYAAGIGMPGDIGKRFLVDAEQAGDYRGVDPEIGDLTVESAGDKEPLTEFHTLPIQGIGEAEIIQNTGS